MNYGKLISRAIEIVKKNKLFWILGTVLATVAGGGSASNFSSSANSSDLKSLPANAQSTFSSFSKAALNVLGTIPPTTWILFGVGLLLLILISLVTRLLVKSWVEGALIGAANDVETGMPVSLATSSKHGRRALGSLLWLNFIPGAVFFVIFIALALLIGLPLILPISTAIKAVIIILVGIPAILVMIIASFIVSLALIFAQRKVVVEGGKPWEALKASVSLVKKHFLEQIALGLINFCFSCGIGCGTILIIILFIPLAIGIYLLTKVSLLFTIPFALILLILFIAVMLFTQGLFMAFKSVVWTLFCREIGIVGKPVEAAIPVPPEKTTEGV